MDSRNLPKYLLHSITFNVFGVALLLLVNQQWPAKRATSPDHFQFDKVSSARYAEQHGQARSRSAGGSNVVKSMEIDARALLTGFKRPQGSRVGGNAGGKLADNLKNSNNNKTAENGQSECHCGTCADLQPCCRERDKRKVVYLAIMCKSAPKNVERRQKMRAGWDQAMRADSYYNAQVMDKLVHFSFVIGKSGDAPTDAAVDGESRIYNDTVVGNFKDTYQNLTSKLLWTLTYVQKTMRFRYLLMSDDDTFINLSALTQWLVVSPNEQFYSGMMEKDVMVVRDPQSKWYVRRSFYGPETYPPYHQGFGYVTSCDSVENGMKYVSGIPLFGIDDTVMGMLMYVGGVKASHMPRFHSAPYYCQKFLDSHPLVIGDIETAHYDKYTKDLVEFGCAICEGKPSKPPKSSAG